MPSAYGQFAVTAGGTAAITSTSQTPVDYGIVVCSITAGLYINNVTTATTTNSLYIPAATPITINPSQFGLDANGVPDLSKLYFIGDTTGTATYCSVKKV